MEAAREGQWRGVGQRASGGTGGRGAAPAARLEQGQAAPAGTLVGRRRGYGGRAATTNGKRGGVRWATEGGHGPILAGPRGGVGPTGAAVGQDGAVVRRGCSTHRGAGQKGTRDRCHSLLAHVRDMF